MKLGHKKEKKKTGYFVILRKERESLRNVSWRFYNFRYFAMDGEIEPIQMFIAIGFVLQIMYISAVDVDYTSNWCLILKNSQEDK